MVSIAVNNSFRLLDAISKGGSNLDIFKEIGRVSSNVALSLTTGNAKRLCQIGTFIKIIYKICIDCKVHIQFLMCIFTCSQRFEKKVITHFYTTITQNTSVYQSIWMTGYLNWYVIANTAYNMLIIWPISQDNSFPPSNTVGVISVLL